MPNELPVHTHMYPPSHTREYRRPNMVIAAVGNIKHDHIVERISTLFHALPNGAPTTHSSVVTPMQVREEHMTRPTAQTHIVVGTRTFGHCDPRRYGLVLLSNAFGGGMSSRLFQKVREELGLAYAVYSYQSFHELAGVTGVYVGTRHEWADRATEVIRQQYAQLASDGLTADELADFWSVQPLSVSGGLILIDATNAESAEVLAEVVRAGGYSAVWQSPAGDRVLPARRVLHGHRHSEMVQFHQGPRLHPA